MRHLRLSLGLLLAAVVVAACTDRTSPTAPVMSSRASLEAGTCTTIGTLTDLVTYVFGAGSPNVSSGLAKLDQVERQLRKGDLVAAREAAEGLIAFVQLKASELPGRDQVQLLISLVECYSGITSDSFLIYPTDQPQTIVTASGRTGLQLPGEPVSEPTLVTVTELPDETTGLLDTKLDVYPGFILITQQSGVSNSLVKPIVVGVCPTGGIPTVVRDRLRLGHQASAGFRITSPADASFLDCESVVGSASSGSKLPGWVQSLASLVLPKPLFAAVRLMTFSGGVGGTVTEFSPFGPVDPELSFGGGVGGTVTEFIRDAGGSPVPKGPASTTSTATVVGAGSQASLGSATLATASATHACNEGIVGTAVSTECRPRVTITTANGTILTGVPVSFAIGLGGGTTAIDDPTTRVCGTFGGSASTVTNVNGKAGACWTLGATAGSNTLVATASAGGDAPTGVFFTPATSPFTVMATKATATITLSGLNQTYSGSPLAVTATTAPAGLETVNITYDGSATAPTGAGSYAVVATLDNPSWEGTASGSLVIARGSQSALAATGPSSAIYGAPAVQLGSTGGSGTGDVTYSAGASTACSVTSSGSLTMTSGTGTCAVTATKAADTNFNSVTSEPLSITPVKATATVTLSGLAYTYDGGQKNATAATSPAGLAVVTITYAGGATLPTNAGSYAVFATLANMNYAASPASGTLVISRVGATATSGSATINFGDAVPSIPCSVTGLLSLDAGSVTCATGIPPVNVAGAFTTTPVISPANPLNYAMTGVTGVLTVRGYIQSGCFSTPIYNVMPDTKSAQRKGSNLPVKCTLTSAAGVPLTFQQGDLVVQDRGTNPATAPNITGTVVFSGTNLFTASTSGNYSYGLNTGAAGFIAGHYYYVTATWRDGSKSQGWFLLK